MADPIEQLERLHALMEKGVLTAEEFQQQKSKLLAETSPRESAVRAVPVETEGASGPRSATPSSTLPVVSTLLLLPALYVTGMVCVGGAGASGGGGMGDLIGLACVGSPLAAVLVTYGAVMSRWMRQLPP